MSKDAIMIAIDAGSSMDQKFSQNASRLKIAMECFKLTLQQKLFNNSNHQIGFSLFGDNQSQDGNNYELQSIQKPTLQFVRKVIQLSQATLNNSKEGGDIFDSINYITSKIAQHCGKKKYNKRAFIFTNGMGQTTYGINDLHKIVQQLRDNNIKLNIIPLDFMENYDMDQNTLEGEGFLQPNQQKNSALLMKLRSLQMQSIQIFPTSLAIQLYKKFRKRDTNPVALYKGSFQIAPGLSIQVATYKAIRKQKLKSLQKYDTTVPFDPNISKQSQVINDIVHTVQGDQTGKVVDKQNQINAYPYGPNLIPISGLMEAGMKIFQEKNFKLLGFVDKNKIPRHVLMGQADIVIPTENHLSKKLFTSLIYSMITLNRYAIARYVPRTNKNGVSPKLVTLMPYRTAEKQCFYLIELPTVEDVREYPFNSLKKATDKQRQLVRQLVEKMSLYHTNGEEEIQEVKIQNTFNPVHQYFYQTVFHRALHNQNEIPDLDPVIRNYITPQQKKYQETEELSKEIKKQFKLKKKQLASQKQKQKKTVVWRDIIDNEQKNGQNLSMADTQLQDVNVSKKFRLEDDDPKFDISMPILSFRKMLTYNQNDLVNQALKNMIEYIQNKANQILSNQDKLHILECVKQLRIGCIEQKQEDFWDSWLQKCQFSIGEETFKFLISQGLGYINKSNQNIYKVDELHPLQPQKFDEDDLD